MKEMMDHRPSSLAQRTDRYFFNCIREMGVASRAKVAEKTWISKPTVSESAQRLLEKGLIKEASKSNSSESKRPSVMYEINADFGCTLAVALEEATSWVQVRDFAGAVLIDDVVEYSKSRDQQQFIQDLLNLLEQSLQSAGSTKLLSIGVSVADPVNPSNGEVLALPYSPFPLAHGINFPQILYQKFSCPVTVDNDVNWATFQEYTSTQSDNFAYVHLGRGIGCGLFLNGAIIRGATGLAGEIGYLALNDSPPLLEKRYDKAFFQRAKANEVKEDSNVLKAISQVILATCTLTNPQRVVLGGELSKNTVICHFIERALLASLGETRVEVTSDPEKAAVNGAAQGALELSLASLQLVDPITGSLSQSFIYPSDCSIK